MIIITFLTALFISCVAAYFSIAGLVAIFPGATVAVMLMGMALEMGKLVSASWIYRFWNSTTWLLKTYFVTAVIILSFITSIGIFGYLTRAHVEGSQGLDANTDQIVLLDEQIVNERQNITMSRQTLQQMDAAINNLAGDATKVERLLQIRNTQKKEKNALLTGIGTSNENIQQLQKQKSLLNVGQRKMETEVGPIKYVAQLVYSNDDATTIDKAVRLLILLLIFVFDPLAILLVVATSIMLNTPKEETTGKKLPVVVLPPTKNIGEQLNNINVTSMSDDWNPGNWFKIVKTPKR